jgi:hypothetical protein
MMALIQMDYPLRNEPYFVSSFIAGLTEGIKHYLISNNPLTLCDTYWKAKELEKGIMIKKFLLTPSSTYTKANTTLFNLFLLYCLFSAADYRLESEPLKNFQGIDFEDLEQHQAGYPGKCP